MANDQVWAKHMDRRGSSPVPIVAEGAIVSAGVADNKLIAIVIIDTTDRPDIDELVRVHEHLPPGDVVVQWGALSGAKDSVALILKFKRPIETVVVLNFDLNAFGGTVDLIISSRALYLQPGRPGEKPSTTFGNPKILAEVPETGFREKWKAIKHDFLVKHFRNSGLTQRDAKSAATHLIEEFGKIVDFRWPVSSQASDGKPT
jgi:hypothetical protein